MGIKKTWLLRSAGAIAVLSAMLLALACDNAPKPPEMVAVVWNDSDIVFEYADEKVDYATLKRWWTYHGHTDDPEAFEALSDEEKIQNADGIGVAHLLAKKGYLDKLDEQSEYKARLYELTTRFMPNFYAQKVVAKEFDPTDAEILTMIPPAIPEVQVRVMVSEDMAGAKAAYDRIVAGEDMEKLIREESTGLSSSLGGLSKWYNINRTAQYPMPTIQRFIDTEAGTLLEPFYHDIGFVVIRIEGQRSKVDVENLWLAANRESFIGTRLKVIFEAHVAVFFENNETVIWDDDIIGQLGREGGPGLNETIITIRDMEFTPNILLNKKMIMAGHDDAAVFSHVRKFIRRALITEEAISLGLMEQAEFEGQIKVMAELHLSNIYKRKVAEDATNAEITDEDIRAYYDSSPGEFTEPERWCISMIDVGTEEEAATVASRLDAGDAFSAIATEFSRGVAGQNEGRVGCYTKEKIPGIIMDVVANLEVGGRNEKPLFVPLKAGEDGWIFVQLDDAPKAALVPFDRVIRPIIEGRVQTQRRTKALTNLLSDVSQELGYKNCFILTERSERSVSAND